MNAARASLMMAAAGGVDGGRGEDAGGRTRQELRGAVRGDRRRGRRATASRSTPPAAYSADVCGWTTSGLTIVGVNGRPKIDAAGMNAGGKATWVISGDDTTVENVELTGATAVDANGAGIRQEGANLTVRGCWFHDNQDGILAGDKAGSTITIEASEFDHNGAGDGQSHNLYINHVDKLVFRWNYSHHAVVGHLLKTRALVSDIRYNRLSDEADGTSSYEINVPNAGTTMIVGNVIEQGPMTDNSAIIDYGSEPMGFNATQDLYVVNNTIVNDRAAGGTFVQIAAMVTTPAVLTNNIFVGGGTVTNQAGAVQTASYTGTTPMFAAAAAYDYHLVAGSPCVNMGVDPGMTAGGVSLLPAMEYVHPTAVEGRMSVGVIDIGAYELGGGVPLVDGGAPDGSRRRWRRRRRRRRRGRRARLQLPARRGHASESTPAARARSAVGSGYCAADSNLVIGESGTISR